MDEHAAWIGGYMLARGMKTIQARDIYRAYPALKSAERRDQIAPAMHVLEMYDWVQPIRERKGVYVEWAINPSVQDGRFEKTAEAERSRRGIARDAIHDDAASRRQAKERATALS
jgi:hypothetical protein